MCVCIVNYLIRIGRRHHHNAPHQRFSLTYICDRNRVRLTICNYGSNKVSYPLLNEICICTYYSYIAE